MKKLGSLILALCLLIGAVSACSAEDYYGPESNDNIGNWYEVFVYSYQDSNGDGIGDLPGLLSRLDYIADMGYTGLWLMPVFPSPSYHKYDVTDYMNIDPAYGGVDDLKSLVDACHKKGIKIILDLPINHTSVRHPWFLSACDALKKGETDNKYVSYYHFEQAPFPQSVQLASTSWYYEEQFSGGGMPDLDLDNENVFDEISAICNFWLNDCGVDGFRLDAVISYYGGETSRNVSFLARLKALCEKLKPGSYLVGEAWTNLSEIAKYYESGVDSFFLFPASQAEGYIVKTIRAKSPAATYQKNLTKVLEAIPNGILAPFLGNHDTGRAIGLLQARTDSAKAKFAEALLAMMGGNTFTYYGEEIGMVGSGDDPNKRTPMYWNENDRIAPPPGATKVEYAYPSVDEQMADPLSLLNYCRELNTLKNKVPSIARGTTEFVFATDFQLVIRRVWETETSYICINFSADTAAETIIQKTELRLVGDLETGTDTAMVAENNGSTAVTLPAYGIAVLVEK